MSTFLPTGTGKRLLLKTTSSNPEYTAGCDCAVVELNAGLCTKLTNLIEIVNQAHERCRDVYEVYFWSGYEPTFYDSYLTDALEADEHWAPFMASFEDTGTLILPDSFHLGTFEPKRTECEQLIVRLDRAPGDAPEISWVVIPKHTELYITTQAVAFSQLQRLFPGGVVSYYSQGK